MAFVFRSNAFFFAALIFCRGADFFAGLDLADFFVMFLFFTAIFLSFDRLGNADD